MKRALLCVTLSVISSLSHADAGRASLSAGAVEAKTTLPSVGHRPAAAFHVLTCRPQWQPVKPDENGNPLPPTVDCFGGHKLDESSVESDGGQRIWITKGSVGDSDYYYDRDGDEADESSLFCTLSRVKDHVAYEIKTERCDKFGSYSISRNDVGYRIRVSAQFKSDIHKAQKKGYIPNPAEGNIYVSESPEPVGCPMCPPPPPVIPGR